MTFGRLFICLFLQLYIIDAAHFRGGSITWHPLNNTPSGGTVKIQIYQRWSWRRSAGGCDCNASTVATGGLIGASNTIACVSGNCNYWANNISTLTSCTDFSGSLDISSGENYITRTIPLNIQFSIVHSSGAWLANLVIGGNGVWSVVTRINTAVRPDGYINSSPTGITLSTIYRQVNIQYVHVVHIVDFDGTDILKCRWSTASNNYNSFDECGGVCLGVQNATLIQDNCTIIFTLTVPNQYAAVALQIEDYYNRTATVPMSSVPVQFLFYGYTAPSGCTTPPAIIGNRLNQACVSAPIGNVIIEYVTAQVYCPGKNITDFITSSPGGMTKSTVQKLSRDIYQLILRWTPTANQYGSQGLCVGVIDNTNIQSDQWCITYVVGYNTPSFIQSSAYPVGTIFQNQTIFSIQTTRSVNRPLRNGTYIYFTDATTNTLVQSFDCASSPQITYSNFTINIRFSTAPWIFGHSYYITFDSGVATGTESCGLQSALITNSTYWAFNIFGCHSPQITLIPGSAIFSSPKQYRRNQDFYIVSIIELNCTQSVSMTTQWTIKNCTTATCSNAIQLDPRINTGSDELYIPAETLPYGTYELKLTVTIHGLLSLSAASSVYVRIITSNIAPNLVQFGTSMITSGQEQDLSLNPGVFSVDLDGYIFNETNWKYEYYCRIYGLSNFPNFQGSLIPIGDPTIDALNPSCFENRTDNQTSWKFNSINSSLMIRSQSLQSDRTYQFRLYMENRQNPSTQATGYLLVKVENTHPPMIVIGCVISTMCLPNMEFQLVNPTTQVALFSLCIGNCSTIQNITWNIYYGTMNSSSNITQWMIFNQTNLYENIWFFGTYTTNFTATDQLFLWNPQWNLWRFEVVYRFLSETSVSSLNFIINQPPSNGSCSIDPLNGTTSTLFNIICSDWLDDDDIKDYSVYVWTTDRSKQMIIAYSSISTFQIRLPSGDDSTFELYLIVYIRDELDCITEYNISSSINVRPDLIEINDLINDYQKNSSINNPMIQLLAKLNEMNEQNLDKAISNGIPPTSISISPLGSQRYPEISILLNVSALNEYNKELNIQANIREYLIKFTTNLTITTLNSIKLQSTSLVQLTKATNQLTRNTLTIVSNRCYQLTMALYLMSTRISYEDVQTAATQLTQCATNILSAVNGPLQQRINVLDMDSLRATSFPDDYDTDLEFDWSNLNLFADGNDFSWSTIEKNRIIYYQKQLANEIISTADEIILLLTLSLNIHLNLEQNFIINTSQVFMSLETKSIKSLLNKQIKQIGNAQINLPSTIQTNQTNNQIISIRSMVEPLAPYGKSQPNTNLSTSISLTILDKNGNEILIETNENNSIEILIPHDPNVMISSMILQNVTSINSTFHQQLFYLHYVNITNPLAISVHLELRPLKANLSYLLIYKFDGIPQLDSSINQIDGWTLLCPSNLTNESIYTYFLNNQQTSNHQSLIIGLRELNSTEMIHMCFNSSLNNPPITNEKYNFTSNYELRIYTSGCYYFDKNNQWKSDGLTVGSLTNHYQTQCFSKHLTKFAGGFVILPESINWKYVFANADFNRNKTIYLTIIFILLIYLILMIYSKYKDKKDLKNLGVTSLPDNHRSDQYFYQIIVFTGQRKDAGTKSNVHFMVYGDNDQTSVRSLASPHRKILQRGGIDSFIMAVSKSLGILNCIRLWHDNTGKGSSSSWFLKYIIIRDLQTMDKYHFICQRWFAVEKDDEKIERILPVAGTMEKSEFSYVLSKQAYHSVSDGHLWFSIFSRPLSNKFTRVQRCTCCFVLLFVSMFLSVMYYDLQNETNINQNSTLLFGSNQISSEQVIIGIIVELFALIPSIFLVQFFRRIRSHQRLISPLYQTLYQIKPSLQKENNKKKVKSLLTFPWWCLFVAYSLCMLLIGVSIFFIIARGIEFGDVKTQKWLISIISGFFSSIFFTQPMKIFGLAIFFAFFCRKSHNDEEAHEYLDENELNIDKDEEYLHTSEKKSSFIDQPRVPKTNRLNKSEIAFARHRRLKEIQMWSILREMFTYLAYLSVLFIITYSHGQSDSFFQVKHLRNYLLNTRQNNLDYTKVLTKSDYWNWLESSFVENIRAQQWYNGDAPRNLSGFINDKTNRLIGWITMRQLRLQSHFCSIGNLNFTCQYNEETDSFAPGWKNQTTTKPNSTIDQAFQYKSKDELDTYTVQGTHGNYDGGGYVYEFRGRLSYIQNNLSQLHQLEWIDDQTRAIILQLNLYNPNVQLFTSVTFLIEFLSTGGISTESFIQPMQFYTFTSLTQLICLIIYMIFIVYLMFKEIRLFLRLKWKYFLGFWSIIELGIIICSWTGVGIYVWRYHEYSRIGKLFSTTNGYVYINLQLLPYVNNVLMSVYGFCCFFGTIKLVRLCRFNYRIYLFIQTLRIVGKELISFSLMFSIVFLSFNSLFYLLFVSKLWSCSTFFQTTEMLFEMTLMNFNAQELMEAAAFLAPLCFSLFILLVVFVCLSMFLSIVNRSFRRARENVEMNDQIYTFIFHQFLQWIGLRKQCEEEIHEKNSDTIKILPEKLDQLLDAINRLYIVEKVESGRTEEITF